MIELLVHADSTILYVMKYLNSGHSLDRPVGVVNDVIIVCSRHVDGQLINTHRHFSSLFLQV